MLGERISEPPWTFSEYGPLEDVPEWAEALVRDAIADLQVPHSVPMRVGWTPGMLWLQEGGTRGLTGMDVDPPEEPEEAQVMLAEHLQDQFFFETAAAWGESRPACPGHTHPASPHLVDGVASWICPATARLVARFGAVAAG